MPVHKGGDAVNHPPHYNEHPSGVECIEIVRHYNFNIGNAIKYLWRMGLKLVPTGKDAAADRKKAAAEIEDLKKAIWYLNDELGRLTDIYHQSLEPKKDYIAASQLDFRTAEDIKPAPPPKPAEEGSLVIEEKEKEDRWLHYKK